MAATTQFRVFFDVDSDTSTGCSIGDFDGVEQVLVTEVTDDDTNPRVTRTYRQLCTGNALGELIDVVTTGWPSGWRGSERMMTLETRIPFEVLGTGMPQGLHVGFDATRGAAVHAALRNIDGSPVMVPAPPRRRRAVGDGSDRMITMDGAIADWTNVRPTITGIQDGGSKALRLLRVFSFANAVDGYLYFAAQMHISSEAPFADDDQYLREPGQELSVGAGAGVLKNDGDPNGLPLTATKVSEASRGTVTLNPDGSFTYSPNNAASKLPDEFEYQATNGTANSNIGRVLIKVNLGETPKAPVDDEYETNEDTTLNVPSPGVLDNDPKEEKLVAALFTAPQHGTVTLNADGGFTYKPKANFFGTDTFVYTASKESNGNPVGNATVTITVESVNDAPNLQAATFSVQEHAPNGTVVGTLTFTDPDTADDHTFSIVSGNTGGAFAINPSTGTITVANSAAINWAVQSTYSLVVRVQDDGSPSKSESETITINVTNVPDAPAAVADSYSVNEDATLTVPAPGVLGNDSDPDGDPITAVLVSGPSNGTLTLNPNGSFVYTPNANYNGPDSFTYRASDGTNQSNTVTVTITVNAVNDIPTAVADAYTTNEDTVLNVPAPGVLGNDSDIESPLTAILVTGTTNGTLTLNANGSFTYTPNANYNGTDSFTYKANDGTADSNTVTVTITVTVVNDAPIAVVDVYGTNEDAALNVPAPGVLGNDTDVEGSTLTAVLVTGPANGTLTLNANGSFLYTPNANYNGTDSFTYKANDGSLDSNTVTVTITVTAVNDAPVAVADAYATDEDVVLNVPAPGVLVNDSDVDSSLTAVLVSTTTNGTLTLNANGSFTYTPNANYNGSDSFTYKANDGTADSNTVTVTITVNARNDAPVAVADAYATDEDTALNVPAPGVLANDTDTEGSTLTAVLVTNPSNGTVTLNANGSFTYTPNANYNGPDTFTYRASDSTDNSNDATVTITVNAVNDAPSFTAGPSPITVDEDSGAYSNPWASSISAGPNETQIVTFNVSTPNTALFSVQPSIAPDGTLTFTPAANANGSATLTITLSDDGVPSATSGPATLVINVTAVNDTPSFVKGANQVVDEDSGPQTANPWATAISPGPADEAGQSVNFNVTNDANGLFSTQPSVSPTGVLTYTPAANANGVATVTVTLSDTGVPVATSAPQQFTITINAVDDPPSFTAGGDIVASSDAGGFSQTNWATNISAGPPDESSQTVQFEVTNNSNPGLFMTPPAVSPAGTLTFTPVAGVSGSASITIRLRDSGNTLSGTATFSITLDSAPAVTSTTPAASATGVPTNADVSVTFDENVNVAGAWIQIACGTSGTRTVSDVVVSGGPGTFVINPNADFAAGETCTVTIFASQVTDQDSVDGPDAMAANHTFSFTTDAQPSVTATTPLDNAVGVTTNANVTVTFSEPVNVTGTWFQIVCATSGTHDPSNSNVTGGPTTFTINPNSDFVQGETCAATIFAAQVSDQDTNDPLDQPAANAVFDFTIDAAPSVASVTPANNDFSQQPNTNVTIVFSEPVNVSGNWFSVSCGTSGARTPANTAVSTTDNITFTLDPNSDFAVGETCNATVVASLVSDQDGNDPPDNMLADHVFTFGFDAPPAVTATTPSNNATDRATSTNIDVTFSENVTLAAGWLSVTCGATTLTDANGAVTGGPLTYTFNPTTDLPAGASCTVTIDATKVSDNDTNDPPDNMTANHQFSFTTDAPPAVTTTTPANGATNRPADVDITVNFTEAVTVSTSSFTLDCGGAQAFAVSGSGTSTITINPDANLPAGTTCNVSVVAANVADVDANDPPDAMAANHNFSFTTDAPPAVTSTTPTNAATGVATDDPITIVFSEAVTAGGSSFTVECPTGAAQGFTVGGSGTNTITLTPSTAWAAGVTCSVAVLAAGIADTDANDPPDNMVSNYNFTFSTDAPPAVTTTSPTDGSAASPNANITINFTEAVDVTTSSFTIACPGNQLFNLSGSGTAAITLDPQSDLPAGSTCTVTVVANQVSDSDTSDTPDTMTGNHVFSFTIDAPPAFTTSPIANSTTVPTDANVVVNFSEAVNVTTSSFTLECPTGSAQTFGVSGSGTSAITIDPTGFLPAGTTCTVTILAANVSDADSNDPPDNPTANASFSFTTDAAPSVTGSSPADLATNQRADGVITINFSEPVDVTLASFGITCSAASQTFTVNGSGTATIELVPTADLPSGSSCTVNVVGANVSDSDSFDPPNTMAGNHQFTFGVDAAPAVTTTSPADTATSIGVNANIVINFTEAVTVDATSFSLTCGSAQTFTVSGSGTTAITLDPDSSLPENTSCTVQVLAANVSDVDTNDRPDHPAANHSFTFQTDARPTVISTVPVDDAVGVDPTANITINFSEPVDVTTSSFTINCGAAETFTVGGSGSATITLDPTGTLPSGVPCVVTVVAANVSDSDAGDPPDTMAVDYTFDFQTDQPPAVTTTSPADNAGNVVTNTNVVINFSENVAVTGSSFTINCSGNQAFSVTGSGTSQITLDPTADLPAGTNCVVTVVAANVTDSDTFDPPDNMTADYVFDFTTDALPTVTGTSPATGAANVPTDANVVIDFSENVDVTGASFTLTCGAAQTFAVTGTGSSQITINPDAELPAGTLCTVNVVGGSISDSDAFDPPNNPASSSFSFTTDARPSVTAVTPLNGASNVAINANIVVTFSENVDVTGSSFTLTCGAAQPFSVTGTGTNVVTLDPTANLPEGTLCNVKVVAAQTVDSDTFDPPNTMAADFDFSFTTDAAPAVTTTSPANSAIDIDKTSNIVINFNENVDITTSSFTIECPTGSAQTFTVAGSGTSTITLDPTGNLPPGTICTVTTLAANVADSDAGDPPDNPAANHSFSFGVKPEATNDNYTHNVIGNVGVNTDNSTEFSVLTNDVPSSGVTINTSGTTAAGGTIVMGAGENGKFTYTPPRGYEGPDSFTYTISNAAGTSASATVSLNVAGMIWFIDAAAPGGGDGRLATPYNSLGSFQSVNNGTGSNPGAGDNIFLYENPAAYAGPVVLLSNQKLIGQDATATLAAITGVTVGADSFALPAMNSGNGTTTTVSSVSAGVNAVTLNSAGTGNVVRGLLVNTGNATAKGIFGNGFGTLTAADVSITGGSGPALDLNNGALAAAFGSIAAGGTGAGISLTNITGGSLTSGTTTVTNPSGSGINVNTSAATLNFGNTNINKNATAGAGVSLTASSGNVTFGTLVATTSNGTTLFGSNNSGAIAVTTGAGSTLSATGGAAIDITNASGNPSVNLNFSSVGTTNSAVNAINLDRVGGAGLNITGATTTLDMAPGSANVIDITNSAMTTVSISAGGTLNINDRRSNGIVLSTNTGGTYTFGATTIANPNSAAGNGIHINNSSSAVTFASATISSPVVGTAETDGDSDGIPNSDGDGNGIFLKSNTGSFTLNAGTISAAGDQGIDARDVQNVTLSNVAVTNARSHGVRFTGLGGTNSITNSTISGFGAAGGNIHDGLRVINNNVNMTGLTVNSTTFTGGSVANDGIWMEARGTSNMTLNVNNNSQFTDLFGDGIQVTTIQGASGTVNITVQDSDFLNAAASGNGGVSFGFGGTSVVNFNVLNNVFNNIRKITSVLPAINLTAGGALGSPNTPNVTGVIDGNDIDNLVAANRGISLVADNASTGFDVRVSNNFIDSFPSTSAIPIFIDTRDNVSGANVRIEGNDIGQAGALWTGGNGTNQAILVQTQGSSTMATYVSGNTIDANGRTEIIRFRSINTSSNSVTVTGNDIADTAPADNLGGIRAELAAATANSATICFNAPSNTIVAGGQIRFDVPAGTAVNVTQASAAALSAANSGATVVGTGTPTYNQPACSQPPAIP